MKLALSVLSIGCVLIIACEYPIGPVPTPTARDYDTPTPPPGTRALIPPTLSPVTPPPPTAEITTPTHAPTSKPTPALTECETPHIIPASELRPHRL